MRKFKKNIKEKKKTNLKLRVWRGLSMMEDDDDGFVMWRDDKIWGLNGVVGKFKKVHKSLIINWDENANTKSS